MNPKKMKVSELRAALESRGLSSNGLKSELIQRLEMALDEEEFGSEAQELDPLAPPKQEEEEEDDAPAQAAATSSPVKKKESPVKKPAAVAAPSAPVAPKPAPVKEAPKAEAKKVEAAVESTAAASSSPEDAKDQPLTEEEKRKARAAKFGIPLSLEDKKVGLAKLSEVQAFAASICLLGVVLINSLVCVLLQAERAKRFNLPTAGKRSHLAVVLASPCNE